MRLATDSTDYSFIGDMESGVTESLPPHLQQHERPPLLVNPEVHKISLYYDHVDIVFSKLN